MESLIEKCLDYYSKNSETTLSENTINAYRIDLKQFREHLKGKGILKPQEITKEAMAGFRDMLESKEMAKTSINRKLTAISRFFFYLEEVESIKIKVKPKLIKIQTQNFKKDLLSNNDIERIIRAIDKTTDKRTKAILLTLFYTGARITEALQIGIDDIEKDTIQIKGKGSKYRNLYIPKKLKAVWKEYSKVRLETDEKALFTGERGAITRATVNCDLRYYAGQAKVKKDKVHPHALRHLYTKNIWNLGLNPGIIKQLLGHNLNITDLYLSGSEKELLISINKLDYTKENK